MFNIYAKSGLPLGAVNELAINTDSAGTISFSVDNPGLVVNGGAPYVVPGLTNTYVPRFDNYKYANLNTGLYDVYPAAAIGGPTPNATMGKTAIDGKKRFTVAFTLKHVFTKSTNWANILYLGTGSYYVLRLNNSLGMQLYFVNTAGVGQQVNAGASVVLGELARFVTVYDFDVVARIGTYKTYKNTVVNPASAVLNTAHEIGFYNTMADTAQSIYMMGDYAHGALLYDVMIHKDVAWSDATITQYMNQEVIDPSNYTVYWPMTKNNDLPYLLDYDLKGNVPLYIPGPHMSLEWVAKGVAPSPFDTQHVVPITSSAAGTYTITATKTDVNGVIETFNSVVEVLDPPASEQYTAQLLIYSDVAATALITMDNPIINFPASVVVAAGKNQISGLITGDGVCNVTVNINGVTDVTTFTIDRIAASLSMGPDIDQGVESFPASLKMHVYSNSDDSIDLVSDSAEIIVSSPVVITNGVAEVDVTINEETTGTITATNDLGMTAVAAVDVYYNPLLLKIGPAQTVLRGDRDLTIYLIVVSDTPGTVALASSDANLEVPASVVIGDDLYTVIECVAVGGCVATITATKGIRTGTCILTVNQSANASPVPSRGTSRNVVAGEERAPFNINRESLPTLEDIDYAVFDWLNQMDIFVECSPEMGGFKKVPVMWVGTERSFQTKVYKDFRDLSGSLNPPFVAIQRKGFNKDLNDKGEHWLNTPVFYDFMQGVLPIKKQIRHDKTSQFINNSSKRKNGSMNYKFEEDEIKPVYETLYVPIPVYVSMNYEISIWTSYRTHMNTIQQKLITYVPAGNFNKVVLPHGGHNFEGFLDGDVTEDGNLEALEKEERKLTATFKLKVLGHVAGEEKNINSPEVSRRETAAKLTFDVENIEK